MQVIPQSYIQEKLADLRLWFFDLLTWIAQFIELPRELRLYMQRSLRIARSDLRASRLCCDDGAAAQAKPQSTTPAALSCARLPFPAAHAALPACLDARRETAHARRHSRDFGKL